MSNREPLVAQRYGAGQQYLRAEASVLDPGRLVRVLGRHWLWLVVPPIVLAAIGGLLSRQQPSRYESTAMVVLQPTAAQDRLSGDRSNALAEREIQTEEELLNGPAMSALIRAEIGDSIDFEARAIEGTDLIELTAQAAGADQAASAADAIAELYIVQRHDRIVADLEAAAAELEQEEARLELELAAVDASLAPAALTATEVGTLPDGDITPPAVAEPDPATVRLQSRLESELAATEASLEELRSELALTNGDARIAASAVPPSDRVSPNPTRSAVVWAMLGVLIGLGLVWVRDVLDRRIRTAADLLPLPGSLDFVGRINKPTTTSLIGPAVLLSEDVADRFRVLASNSLTDDDQPLTVQITGVHGGEGATFVAANLAATLAIGGWGTVVVDADLASGDVHGIFGVEARPGTKQLLGGETLQGVVQATNQIHGLGVVARGSERASDATLHNSSLTALLRGLADRFDVTIIDSPPILHSGDAAVLANHVDKTILVAMVNETTRPEVEQAVEAVTRSGGMVTAIALIEPSRTIISSPIHDSVLLDTEPSRQANGGSATVESLAAVTAGHLKPRSTGQRSAGAGTTRPADPTVIGELRPDRDR